MERYICLKTVKAKPMNLGEYNEYRGWKTTADENPKKKGYLVIGEEDEYITWSPKAMFNADYRRNVSFGLALEALKQGKKVCRAGWTGKKQYIELAADGKSITFVGNGVTQLRWLASQDDMLAEDWQIIGVTVDTVED